MIYLCWWIAIGVLTFIVVLGSHLLTKKKESDSLRDLLDAANPERTKFSYRLLNNIVAPALGSVVIVIAWPVAIYMKPKELFPGRNGGVGETLREFTVEIKHLQERLSVHEIEQREIVANSLKVVPGIPFGHLHQAWAKFLDDLLRKPRSGRFPLNGQLTGVVKNCERAMWQFTMMFQGHFFLLHENIFPMKDEFSVNF